VLRDGGDGRRSRGESHERSQIAWPETGPSRLDSQPSAGATCCANDWSRRALKSTPSWLGPTNEAKPFKRSLTPGSCVHGSTATRRPHRGRRFVWLLECALLTSRHDPVNE